MNFHYIVIWKTIVVFEKSSFFRVKILVKIENSLGGLTYVAIRSNSLPRKVQFGQMQFKANKIVNRQSNTQLTYSAS